MRYDVAIIGAGVVGALTARELSRYQLKVALLEKESDVAGGASRANSGIVHGGFDPVPGTKKAKMNVRGTAMMPALAKELGVQFRQNGSIVLAFSDEEMAHVRKLYDRGIENGVPGLSILSAEELHKMEPNVSEKAVGALLCTSAGIICPYSLTIAAAGNAMDNGVALFCDFAVDAIDKTEDGFIIHAGEKTLEAAYVVNCAGLFGDRIAKMVGDDRYEIVAKKGEYMLLDHTAASRANATLFQVPTAAGKGVLVSPTAHNNLLVGPTSVAIDDKCCRDTTPEGLDAIRAAAAKTMADIPYRQVITSFTGLRAALVGAEDFVIEASVASPRFVQAVGIESPGLSSAPAIAEELVRLLRDGGLVTEEKADWDGTRASYHRFGEMSDEEKNELIAREPAYGHVICRCETITEGEILEAIRRNPKARTMDAVKRRVRAGMGRCQGGFCSSYVSELIAREHGIPETEVTKCGGNSRLLFGETKGGN